MHVCLFQKTGFQLDGRCYSPCGTQYHQKCVRAGTPFTSRLANGRGLSYPAALSGFPFVCELCTVRANVGRDLIPGPADLILLALERMRLIDLGHYWGQSTLSKHALGLRYYSQFLKIFNIPAHHITAPAHPAVDPSIPLYWSIEHKSIQRSSRSRSGFVTYHSLRGLRSALSSYVAFSAALLTPTQTLRDEKQRVLGFPSVSCTDNISTHFVNLGLSARLGTRTRPSKILYARHLHFNQTHRLHLLRSPSLSLFQRYNIVAAEVAELIGFLGWIRGGECFSLRRSDVVLIPPSEGLSYGLPSGVGAVLLQLLPETKSSRTLQADVVVSWQTSSGLLFGRWLTLLFTLMESLGLCSSTDYLFQNPSTFRRWDSTEYRHRHLFPLLLLQRSQGDPYLFKFDGSAGNCLSDHFTMFHLYRRSGRSHCRLHRPGCQRAATTLETYLHGRWRIANRGREAIDLHYVEPSLEDRVYITLLCF